MKHYETTYCLYANVSSWRYACEAGRIKETASRPNPHIGLEIAAIDGDYGLDGIFSNMPLYLDISCDDQEQLHLLQSPSWQLDLIPASDDEPIMPRFLSAGLAVTETSLRDLKDCLFLTANSADCSVKIQLAVQENGGRCSENDVAEHERKNI